MHRLPSFHELPRQPHVRSHTLANSACKTTKQQHMQTAHGNPRTTKPPHLQKSARAGTRPRGGVWGEKMGDEGDIGVRLRPLQPREVAPTGAPLQMLHTRPLDCSLCVRMCVLRKCRWHKVAECLQIRIPVETSRRNACSYMVEFRDLRTHIALH